MVTAGDDAACGRTCAASSRSATNVSALEVWVSRVVMIVVKEVVRVCVAGYVVSLHTSDALLCSLAEEIEEYQLIGQISRRHLGRIVTSRILLS